MSSQPDKPNPPLPDDVSGEIGKQLQLTLVELIALSLAGKQLQWASYGREFVSVHRHLHELVGEWRELEDAVAERASAMGIALDGTAAAVIELDDHRPLEPGFTEAGDAIERLCSQLWTLRFGSGNAESCSPHSMPSRSTCSSRSSANSKPSSGCCGHSWLTSAPTCRLVRPVSPPEPSGVFANGLRNEETLRSAGLLRGAAEGTRTLDLLHGKQTL